MRKFYWTRKAWYADSADANEITFGNYDAEPFGEMVMKWHNLGGGPLPARLEVFEDAWAALAEFKDLLDELAKVNRKNISQEQFVEILKKCGFSDATPYERPKEYSKDPDAEQLERIEEEAKILREKIAKKSRKSKS